MPITDVPSVPNPTQPSIKNDSSGFFEKSAKFIILTPAYIIAYPPKLLLVTCLNVINFIISRINFFVFNSHHLRYANKKLDGYILSINRSIELLNPWSTPEVIAEDKPTEYVNPINEEVNAERTSYIDYCLKTVVRINEKIHFMNLVVAGVIITVLYKTNVINSVLSWIGSKTSTSSCILYHGTPETFDQAKALFRCANFPFWEVDNTKGWEETKTTFRNLARVFHPDKGGNPEVLMALKAGQEILKKAFTTEAGQEALRVYGCISQVPTPQESHHLGNARRIFECANISTNNCAKMEKAANALLQKLAWVGPYAQEQLSYAYSCICRWNPQPLDLNINEHFSKQYYREQFAEHDRIINDWNDINRKQYDEMMRDMNEALKKINRKQYDEVMRDMHEAFLNGGTPKFSN